MSIKIPDKDTLAEICREFNLRLVILFGSQVIGNTHKESDIDVGILSW